MGAGEPDMASIGAPAMRWASAFSDGSDPVAAARAAAGALAIDLNGAAADLVVCFFDAAHLAAISDVAQVLRDALHPRCLIGASAHGVISREHEVETSPALTVLAASLPGVELMPFVMMNAAWTAALDDPAEFARCTPSTAGAE